MKGSISKLPDSLRRLPVVVLLTAVPGLLLPVIFAQAVYEFTHTSLRLGPNVSRLHRLEREGEVIDALAEAKRGQVWRLLSLDHPADSVSPRPWANDELHLDLPRASRAALEADLPVSGTRWQPASVRVGPAYQRVKVRYRGNSGWHWLYPKKSFRIRTSKQRLLRGRRDLKLSIERPYITALLHDLARELGLLSPAADPVRLFVNKRFYGIEVALQSIDEGFLLAQRRMPGTIYEGESFPSTSEYHYGTRPFWLFHDPYTWGKVAWSNAVPRDYREDLVTMTRLVSDPDEGAGEALRDLFDLDVAVRHMAYKVFVHEWHQGDMHNQRYYLDPTDGRFHPIVWDPEQDDNEVVLTSRHHRRVRFGWPSPVLTHQYWRLTADPDLMHRVLRFLWETLRDPAPLRRRYEALRQLAQRDAQAVRVEQPNLAYPIEPGDLDRVWATLEQNRARLLAALAEGSVQVEQQGRVLALGATGLAGVQVSELVVRAPGRDGLRVVADRNRNGRVDAGESALQVRVAREGPSRYRLTFARPLTILPAYTGMNRTQPIPLPHPLVLSRGVELEGVEAQNAITGEPVERTTRQWGAIDAHSRHPWDRAPEPAPKLLTVAGVRVVKRTWHIPAHQTVVLRPGTRLVLGPRVSIRCEGKLLALGTPARPIVLEPAKQDAVWGVLALQGPGASGSRFRHVTFRGGSQAHLERVVYPGMVSVHHARDVSFESCSFSRNRMGDDALRAAHAEVEVRACSFRDVNRDAIDFDASTGRILFSTFERVGNDGVDLMMSDPLIQGCQFQDCGDKAISVGERSRPVVFNCRIQRCGTGVQVKDRSRPLVLHSAILGCGVGVEATRKNWRYGGGGEPWVASSVVAGNRRDVQVGPASRMRLSQSGGFTLAAGARNERLRVESRTNPIHGLEPDPEPLAFFDDPPLAREIGLLTRSEPLKIRPVRLRHTFRDGLRVESHGWRMEGQSEGGVGLRIVDDVLLASCSGGEQLVNDLELPLLGGSRLHLLLGASKRVQVDLAVDGGEGVLRTIEVGEQPQWEHIVLSQGKLLRISLEPQERVRLRLVEVQITTTGMSE